MEDMLKAVKTERVLPTRPSIEETPKASPKQSSRGQSPQDGLKTLKDGPNIDEVTDVLKLLQAGKEDTFDIATPSALAAQIIQTLVTQTIPDFWDQIRTERSPTGAKELLLDCMRSIPGLGAILTRLKALTTSFNNRSKSGPSTVSPEQVQILVEFLEELLSGEKFTLEIWEETTKRTTNPARQNVMWKEFISLISTSRLISAVAEAEDALQESGQKLNGSWIAKGNEYTRWIGRNIAHFVLDAGDNDNEKWVAATGICSKALILGYTDSLVEELLLQLPLKQDVSMKALKRLVQQLHAHEQRSFLSSVLRNISKSFLKPPPEAWSLPALEKTPTNVAGSLALLRDFFADNDILLDAVVELMLKLETSPLGGSEGLRRAVLGALSFDDDRMQIATEKLLEKFGDQLFIRHSPIVQQEANAQLLLMASGYVHRKQPMFLFTIVKSSAQMHGISSRLNSTSPRARWLGMIVSMSLSRLTDKGDNQLFFTDELMETPEAKWYQKLVHIDDNVGQLADLRKLLSVSVSGHTSNKSMLSYPGKQPFKKSTHEKRAAIPSGLRIVELDSDDEDDLVPHAKPDSDPEDEDEDPTLVQRNKPRAPVYIRDLISGLRDTESYDRHRLALATAPSLIRRKANFGKEVSDHSEELTSILIGMNDQFEMDDFLDLRQEALISVLVALPSQIAPFLARSCFEGDFSLQQRTTMLTALGLGARELAGYKDEDRVEAPSFPTKQLPDHLHKVYSESPGPSVARVSSRIEASMVGPLALNAADQLSGPNALKVRTFSSRMAVEKARKKPIPNALAKIVAENFFFPLTGRWWTQMQAFGNRSVAFSTHLLPTYLRTLAILLHASGPATLSLPQMTSELWDLLLSLRSSALNENDIGVLESLLFAVLTLLEVNEDKQRLATDHGKELVETQEWAKLILERRDAGDEESERVRMLSAAVVVRCHEVVEKWQRLMLGDMIDL